MCQANFQLAAHQGHNRKSPVGRYLSTHRDSARRVRTTNPTFVNQCETQNEAYDEPD